MKKKFFLLKNFQKKFSKKIYTKKIVKILKEILDEDNHLIKSLSKEYDNSYKKNQLKKFKYKSNYRVIGMGGSILGTQAIYTFLKNKIKKNFTFIDNLQNDQKKEKKNL